MAADNCDQCGKDYDFVNPRDNVHIFLIDPTCNHVEAVCPYCGCISRIYLEPEAVLFVISTYSLGIKLHSEADDELRQTAHNIWNRDAPIPYLPTDYSAWPNLPDLTGRQFRDLGDDIRGFERGEDHG